MYPETDEIINYELAKEIKKQGYDFPSTQCYLPSNEENASKDLSELSEKEVELLPFNTAVSIYKLQRWLRDTFKIRVFVVHSSQGIFTWEIRYPHEVPNNKGIWARHAHIDSYMTFEEALMVGLKEGVKLIEVSKKRLNERKTSKS